MANDPIAMTEDGSWMALEGHFRGAELNDAFEKPPWWSFCDAETRGVPVYFRRAWLRKLARLARFEGELTERFSECRKGAAGAFPVTIISDWPAPKRLRKSDYENITPEEASEAYLAANPDED